MAEGVDASFWHTYKPAMYPLSFNDDSRDCSFPASRKYTGKPIQSLVDLSSQAVIRSRDTFTFSPRENKISASTAVFEESSACSEASNNIAPILYSPELHASSPPLYSNDEGTECASQNSHITSRIEVANTFSALDEGARCASTERLGVSSSDRGSGSPHATVIDAIPEELCQPLLKAALLLFHDSAIEWLLSRWPMRSLVLARYVEPMFSDVNPLYSDIDLCMEMRRGVKYTTCLAHLFMICLKRKDNTKLRYLDLTGFPMAEITLSYLVSHVLLLSNEQRQRSIVTTYNTLTQALALDVQLTSRCPSTFPEKEPVVVCVDALLQKEEPHLELCRALHACNGSTTSPLTLRIRRLDISELGVVRIIVLMELLPPQFVVGLVDLRVGLVHIHHLLRNSIKSHKLIRLWLLQILYLTAASFQLNSFLNSALVVLAPPMKAFVNLTSLDFSGNGIFLIEATSDTTVSLATILASLISLQRLNLNSSRITGCLRTLLTGVVNPLTMLRLRHCRLSPDDFTYLSTSHHASHLVELDLSENDIKLSFDSFSTLLRLAVANLAILELELTDIVIADIVPLLMSMEFLSLRYLNIRGTAAPCVDDIIHTVACFAAHTHIQAVRAPFPHDIASADCDPAVLADVRTAFSLLTRKLIAQLHSDEDGRPPFRLMFD